MECSAACPAIALCEGGSAISTQLTLCYQNLKHPSIQGWKEAGYPIEKK